MTINLAANDPSVMTAVSRGWLSFNLLSHKLFHNDCWQPNLSHKLWSTFEPTKAFKLWWVSEDEKQDSLPATIVPPHRGWRGAKPRRGGWRSNCWRWPRPSLSSCTKIGANRQGQFYCENGILNNKHRTRGQVWVKLSNYDSKYYWIFSVLY